MPDYQTRGALLLVLLDPCQPIQPSCRYPADLPDRLSSLPLGISFKGVLRSFAGFGEATQHFAESLVMHLKEDEIEQCAADVKDFLTRQFPAAKRYLIRHGIQPEDPALTGHTAVSYGWGWAGIQDRR